MAEICRCGECGYLHLEHATEFLVALESLRTAW